MSSSAATPEDKQTLEGEPERVRDFARYCKVAGSNLTCSDDGISRWRLHSVDPTSTDYLRWVKISFIHQ